MRDKLPGIKTGFFKGEKKPTATHFIGQDGSLWCTGKTPPGNLIIVSQIANLKYVKCTKCSARYKNLVEE